MTSLEQSPGMQQDTQQDTLQIDLKRFGDWTSWSSWLVLLALLPFSALSIAGFVWLPAWLWGGNFLRNLIVLTAAYFVLLPVVFIPGLNWLQIKLIAPDSRSPTSQERARLRPAWQAVLKRVGKGSNRRYQLRVVDSDCPNAYAGGGRLVIITSLALQLLPQPELEAVLSHELGHHSGMHPIVLLANSWITRPIVWFHSLLRIIHGLSISIVSLARDGWIKLFLLIVLLVPRAVLGLLSLVWKAATLVLLFFGRQAEHQADATAVRLGYGHNLIQAFYTMEAGESGAGAPGQSAAGQPAAGQPAAGFRDRWESHPPTTKRVQKIRRALATAGS